MRRLVVSTVGWLLLALNNVWASGMLIPKDTSLPPLAIKHQRVDIQIKDGVASVKVEQVFHNSTDRDLEAVYVFPLPPNAAISDFGMYINGKRMSGELLEKEKARGIYQDIVRRMRDPGLLEYMGGSLFRVSVFPVLKQADQKIELTYSHTIEFEAGLYTFTYPLKTGEQASRTLEDFTVSVQLKSSQPIKSIYSPSHQVGVSRKGENEAVIGFEEDRAMLDRDFVLYYGVSKKDFGLNLLTHAAKGEDGFFMMMLAPAVQPPDAAVSRKDVTLVFDTSGSMQGKKIEQARNALQYCVDKLNDGDRFNIIRFSTDVELWNEKLVEANAETRKKAHDFVEKIEARGGTAIDGALQAALAMNYDRQRPNLIVFLTDGKPTIGESDTDAILAHAGKAGGQPVRIFVFGVGDDVNTMLLDKLAGRNGGFSQYVKPDENLEARLSSFADKIAYPVLAHPRLAVDKLKTRQVYPSDLPDLFCGEQLTIFGRYEGDGHVAIRLTGEVNGKAREFVFEGTFAAANADNEFIPRLWATRRVGYLLDEIRLHGEERELKDEVMRLSKEYGIMTPYTSYLVLEDDKAYAQHGVDRPPRPAAPPPAEVFARKEAVTKGLEGRRGIGTGDRAGREEAKAENEAQFGGIVPVFDEATADTLSTVNAPSAAAAGRSVKRGGSDARAVDGYMRKDTGTEAIELSEAIRQYKTRERAAGVDLETIHHVGHKTFFRIQGRWVDGEFREGLKTTHVTFLSDEYFKLLQDKPELKSFLALGERVLVVLADGSAVSVEP